MKEISFPFTFFYPRIITREKKQLTETGGTHTLSKAERWLRRAEEQYQYANENSSHPPFLPVNAKQLSVRCFC